MFEDENQQNTYENEEEKPTGSVKEALTSNSAVKAAIFVIGLMICIIVIYALIFAGRTEGGTGGKATQKPGNASSVTLNPNSTPNTDATSDVAPTPSPTAQILLERDSVDAKVKDLQQMLINKGYLDASTELSETFGPQTEKAIKDFQKAMGLEETGKVDNALWDAIETAAPKVDDSEAFELKKGDRGEKVKELQQRLMDRGYMEKADPTDYFGSKTEEAVKLFQKQNNLAETGKVNNAVFAKIESAPVYSNAQTPAAQ